MKKIKKIFSALRKRLIGQSRRGHMEEFQLRQTVACLLLCTATPVCLADASWYGQLGLTQEVLHAQLHEQQQKVQVPGLAALLVVNQDDWSVYLSGGRSDKQQSDSLVIEYQSHQWSLYGEYRWQDSWLGASYGAQHSEQSLFQPLPEGSASQSLQQDDESVSLDAGIQWQWPDHQLSAMSSLMRQSSQQQQQQSLVRQQQPLQRVDMRSDDYMSIGSLGLQWSQFWSPTERLELMLTLGFSRSWRLAGQGSMQTRYARERLPVRTVQESSSDSAAAVNDQDISLSLFYQQWDLGLSWQRSSDQSWLDGYRTLSLGLVF